MIVIYYYKDFLHTYHDGDIVPVVVGEGAVSAQHELLGLEEALQVLRMIPHQLHHVLQPVVVQERIHQETRR